MHEAGGRRCQQSHLKLLNLVVQLVDVIEQGEIVVLAVQEFVHLNTGTADAAFAPPRKYAGNGQQKCIVSQLLSQVVSTSHTDIVPQHRVILFPYHRRMVYPIHDRSSHAT